jgi:hypothetical protein
MTTAFNSESWTYEYLPYIRTDFEDMSIEVEIPNFRIFPYEDPENYIAETNEHLPGDVQERHARMIVSAPALFDALLDIKRLAGKSDDRGYDPFTLLELIAERALTALSNVQQ